MDEKPKIFTRATIKLTLIYTSILMAMSICFSIIIGFTATNEIDRPLDNFDSRAPSEIIFGGEDQSATRVDFSRYFEERNRRANGRIVVSLILINFGVLIFGAAVAFLLARQSLKPIEKAMAEESRFVGDASHELRTPLAVMITENEVLLRDKSPAKNAFREQVASNLTEAQKLQKLANYLLELNRSGAEIAKTEIDLSEPIDDAISRIRPRASAKKIEIEAEIQPVKITSNVEILDEILAIILDNAVKYSPEKSAVRIVANAREIWVSDAGGGISAEDLPHIFDRFYRAEKSRTSEGFGLGLSLARKLCEQIGAKISAENLAMPCSANAKDGQIVGAKFTIKF
jgi:signal transduction histidine kinase